MATIDTSILHAFDRPAAHFRLQPHACLRTRVLSGSPQITVFICAATISGRVSATQALTLALKNVRLSIQQSLTKSILSQQTSILLNFAHLLHRRLVTEGSVACTSADANGNLLQLWPCQNTEQCVMVVIERLVTCIKKFTIGRLHTVLSHHHCLGCALSSICALNILASMRMV